MGRFYLNFSDEDAFYACKYCQTHLTTPDQIVSKNFHGQTGQAYLFHSVMNVNKGAPLEKYLATGKHLVRDIYCKVCLQVVGWTYDAAYVASEKYKEGKSVLEKAFFVRRNRDLEFVQELKRHEEEAQVQSSSRYGASTQNTTFQQHLSLAPGSHLILVGDQELDSLPSDEEESYQEPEEEEEVAEEDEYELDEDEEEEEAIAQSDEQDQSEVVEEEPVGRIRHLLGTQSSGELASPMQEAILTTIQSENTILARAGGQLAALTRQSRFSIHQALHRGRDEEEEEDEEEWSRPSGMQPFQRL